MVSLSSLSFTLLYALKFCPWPIYTHQGLCAVLVRIALETDTEIRIRVQVRGDQAATLTQLHSNASSWMSGDKSPKISESQFLCKTNLVMPTEQSYIRTRNNTYKMSGIKYSKKYSHSFVSYDVYLINI